MTIRIRPQLHLFLAASFAIVTIYLSYPRLASSLSFIPVETALKRHWEDDPIEKDQFPVLIEVAQQANHMLDQAHHWQGLGWLYFLQVNSSNHDTQEGKQFLSEAQIAFETSLKKSPANPASWLRLAWIYALLNQDSSAVIKTLRMSIYTGRAERHLILNRLDLALRYINYFKKEDLPLIREQVQLAWTMFQSRILELIKSDVFDRNTLIQLMADSHPELALKLQETQ